VLRTSLHDEDEDEGPWEDSHPLCKAAGCGHLQVVQLLLEEGFGDQQCKNEALRAAAEARHIPVTQLLVQWGADVNEGADINDSDGGFSYTGPLGLAIRCGQTVIAQ
jgi:hypothetical protein